MSWLVLSFKRYPHNFLNVKLSEKWPCIAVDTSARSTWRVEVWQRYLWSAVPLYHAQLQLILAAANIYFMLITLLRNESLVWMYEPVLSNFFLMFWPVLELSVSFMYNITILYNITRKYMYNVFVTPTWEPSFLFSFFSYPNLPSSTCITPLSASCLHQTLLKSKSSA